MPLNLFGRRRQQPAAPAAPTPEDFMLRSVCEKDSGTEYYPIVCPYCLEKFHVWELQFRTMTVNDGGMSEGYPLEDDEAYATFWEDMNMPVDSQRPLVLRVEDTANVKAVQLWGSQEWIPMNRADSKKLIEKKAICQVRDKFDTPSKQRICPHCHNNLPDVIGRFPNYVISMMGNTSSGKTVYLKRLLSSLLENNLLPNRQIAVLPVSGSRAEMKDEARRMFVETVKNNEPLSDATPVGYMEPVILDLLQSGQHTLLTLFDFPGEAIWQENITPFFQRLMQRNNENTDGWIFLFDSTSMDDVRSCVRIHGEENMLSVKNPDDPQENADPAAVLSQFTEQYGKGFHVELPVAFVFSKADMLSRYADDLGMQPDALCLNHPPLGRNKSKVDLDELRKCDEELRSFLSRDTVLNLAVNTCPKHVFFAVSATGVEVADGRMSYAAPARRVMDPLEWLLWMVGAVPGVACNSKGWVKQLSNGR